MNRAFFIKFIKKYYKLFFVFGSLFLGLITLAELLILKPRVDTVRYYYDTTSTAEMISVDFPFHQELDLIGSTPSALSFSLGDDNINNFKYTITVSDPSDGAILFTRDFENYNTSSYFLSFAGLLDSGARKLNIDIKCEKCKDISFAMYEKNGEKTLGYVGTGSYVNKWLILYSILFFAVSLLLYFYQKEEKNAKQ